MKATLPKPDVFHASPDSKAIANNDGITAHHSVMHDRLTIVDDETGFALINLRLNGIDAHKIAAKYVFGS